MFSGEQQEKGEFMSHDLVDTVEGFDPGADRCFDIT